MSDSKTEELKGKILAKMAAPQLCAVATITEDGKPWVRYMMLAMDERMNMWGATFASFRKVAQIAKNPEVHVTAGAKDMESAESFVQIQGKGAIMTDAATKKAAWNDYLKNIFTGPDDPNFAVLMIKPYRIEYAKMDRQPPEVWQA